MAKSKEKLFAQQLRSKGLSIKSIAKKLAVSPSSVSLWCRDIKLSPKQIATLQQHAHDPNYGKRLENSLKQQKIRINKTKKLLNQGIKKIGTLNKRELFIAGAALYWAEGFKSDSMVGFCNSDPIMIQFFLKWLTIFNYSINNISLRVGVNESYSDKVQEIEEYWAEITQVPLLQFQKPFFQKVKWKKQYSNPENYHGVLRIRVKKSTDFLRRIKGYLEGLKVNSKTNLPIGARWE